MRRRLKDGVYMDNEGELLTYEVEHEGTMPLSSILISTQNLQRYFVEYYDQDYIEVIEDFLQNYSEYLGEL